MNLNSNEIERQGRCSFEMLEIKISSNERNLQDARDVKVLIDK
jgi:hypothetical protein